MQAFDDLSRLVKPTGTIGMVGLYPAQDPGGVDEKVKQGVYEIPFARTGRSTCWCVGPICRASRWAARRHTRIGYNHAAWTMPASALAGDGMALAAVVAAHEGGLGRCVTNTGRIDVDHPCGDGEGGRNVTQNTTTFTVTSSQVAEGEMHPPSAVHQMAGGQNISPDLAWQGEPPETASFAVTMYDPDAPTTVGFVHWVLFNIDPDTHSLAAGAGAAGKNPPGSVLGFTDFGVSEYGGAAPPPGDAPHHYIITVYALDLPHLDLGPTTTYAFFRFMIRDHILGQAQLTGLYGR